MKKQLAEYFKNRPRESISNIKIVDPHAYAERFRPSKRLPSFHESNSHKFDHRERQAVIEAALKAEVDKDLALRNINTMLDEKGIILDSYHP